MSASEGLRRPRIGITTYQQPASWGVWEEEAALLSTTYLDCLVAAGATPLMLPPTGSDPSVVAELDGLVIAGGSDVGAERYGAEADPRTLAQPHRDDHDLALSRAALDNGVPLLAVCRGLQVVNTLLGGTLIQHLPDRTGSTRHQPAPGQFARAQVHCTPGTLAEGILGPEAGVWVYHHQAIEELGRGLRATAHSDDGVIEAIELEEPHGWFLGVQWHPERDVEDLRVFQAFVDAAREPHRTPRTREDTPAR